VASWRDEAECIGVPTEMFFWVGGNGKDRQSTAAKKICSGCDVREQCLAEAMDFERNVHRAERAGIWGGLGPGERYRLWNKIKPTASRHCKRGHLMDEANIYESPSGDVYCRECRRIRRNEWKPPKQVSP
jgi:WhiB family redox-sensing transcriptional regulator